MKAQQELFAVSETDRGSVQPIAHVSGLDAFVDREALKRALTAPTLALDIETETRWSGVGPEKEFGLSYCADVRVISLAWRESGDRGDVNGITGTVLVGPFDPDVLEALHRRFTQTGSPVIAHNAVFDMRGMSRLLGGAVPEFVWDTQTMARLLHPEKQNYFGLLDVADALAVPYSEAQKEMKGKRADLHNLPPKQVVEYALADALVTFAIYEKQLDLVDAQVLGEEAKTYGLVEWECRAVRVYCQMAARGVKFNRKYAQQRVLDLSEVVRQAAERLRDDGLSMPNSPKARVKYIYEVKGIPVPEWAPNSPFFTKGGHARIAAGNPVTLDDLSTSAKVMKAYIGFAESDEDDSEDDEDGLGQYVEQLRALADYLNASKMLKTMQGLFEHAQTDGRIHSLVSISTHAGRRSASHPQNQNWRMMANEGDPAGDMCGVVTGDEGFSLVEIDYSNAENWMSAMVSGDDNLAAACAAEDFHSAMATQYFGQMWEQADKDHRKHLRKMGKTITFGTAYGMGQKKLALSLGISEDEAARLLSAKDRAFPYVTDAKKFAEERVLREGFIKLWTGRKVTANKNQAYRAWNYACQGGVAEMVKRAIVLITEKFEQYGMRSRVALDMHDAIILEVAHDEWRNALSIASNIMQTVMPDEFNQNTTPNIRWIAQPDMAENAKKWGKFQQHFELDREPSPEEDAWFNTGINAQTLGHTPSEYLLMLAKDGKAPANQEQRRAYFEGYAISDALDDEGKRWYLDEDFQLYSMDADEPEGMAQANHYGWYTYAEALEKQAELLALYQTALPSPKYGVTRVEETITGGQTHTTLIAEQVGQTYTGTLRITFEDIGFEGEVVAGSHSSWTVFLTELLDASEDEWFKKRDTAYPARDESGNIIAAPGRATLINWAKMPYVWHDLAQQGLDTVTLLDMSADELKAEGDRRAELVRNIGNRIETCYQFFGGEFDNA